MTKTYLWYAGSENMVALDGHQDVSDLSYPTNAVVMLDTYDSDGQPVLGGMAIPLTYVPGTTGNLTRYLGFVPATVALIVGRWYTAKITAVVSGHVRIYERQVFVQKG